MRFIKLKDIRYKDERETLLINLDNVSAIQDSVIITTNGTVYNVKETTEQLEECIREINALECKYDNYYEKLKEQEPAGENSIQNVSSEQGGDAGLYYTNFVQVKYLKDGEWRKGLCHHEWLLDYEGFALDLKDIPEENIIELDWRNLTEIM